MKKLLFFYLSLIVASCNQRENSDASENESGYPKGIVYASLSRSGEINPETGFPKFEVYCCLYCNKSESYDSKISDEYKIIEDSIKIVEKSRDTLLRQRLQKRGEVLIKMWYDVRDSINDFKKQEWCDCN